MEQTPSRKLPRLHWSAYKGDVQGVLQCITDGCSLHETVSLRNQHGRLVCGITALFLAAQRGHGEIVKLLVTNGASPVQPCFIQGSTELCTPAEVASLNLHFKLARYIKSAARARRQEDAVLALDDDDRASQVSGRLARGLERARSIRSTGGGGGGGPVSTHSGFLGRASRGSMSRTGGAGSVDWGAQSVGGAPALGGGDDDAAADPQRQAALTFLQNIDLAAFDPDADELPVVFRGTGGGGRSSGGGGGGGGGGGDPAGGGGGGGRNPVQKLFRRIMTWGGHGHSHGGGGGQNLYGSTGGGGPLAGGGSPGGGFARGSGAGSAGGGGGGGGGGRAVAASASTRVRGGSGIGLGGPVRGLGLDADVVDPARPDHSKVLQRFLKDLDLAHWQPEHDGPLDAARPASPNSRGGRTSPPRSTRGGGSPARSRA